MDSTPEREPTTVALLFDDADSGARLREALQARGARIVFEGGMEAFEPQTFCEHAPEVVVLNLDPANDAALERVFEALDPARQRLVLNDAEATRGLAGWDAARWARHLANKILGTDVDPPRPAGAEPPPPAASLLPAAAADAGPGGALPEGRDTAAPVAMTEPAMNAALGREIEALIESAAPESLLPDIAAAAAPPAPPVAEDDLDVLLSSLRSGFPADDPAAVPRAGPEPVAVSPDGDGATADLDALLAGFPEPPASPEVDPAGVPAEDGPAADEPVLPRRIPRDEALAPAAPDLPMPAFDGAELDALLAELLPQSAPAADAAVLPTLAGPDPLLGSADPLLASLDAESEPALPEDLAGFDPETWTPPEIAPAASAADAETAAVPAPAEAPAAVAVHLGDAEPDLELMLDAMFEQPLSAENPADRPAAPAAPEWGLLDADAAPAAPLQDSTVAAMAAPPARTYAAEGLELVPLDDAAAPARMAGAARDFERVVVIGASIGGPDAVREFLVALKPGLPLLVVVAQHLDETFFPGYAEQFQRALPHPVHVARAGLRVQAGDVLLVPPRARLLLGADGSVHVEPAAEARYTPSIDDTFAAVAGVFAARTLALVFSGMASDGVRGMRAVAAAGGEIWTQAPENCVVSAMVDAARAARLERRSGLPGALAAELNTRLAQG